MKEDPKLTKAYEIIAQMGNQAQMMRKAIEILLNILPKENLIKTLAKLHDIQIGGLTK